MHAVSTWPHPEQLYAREVREMTIEDGCTGEEAADVYEAAYRYPLAADVLAAASRHAGRFRA